MKLVRPPGHFRRLHPARAQWRWRRVVIVVVAQAALLMVMPFLSAEGQFDQQAASNLRTSMGPAGIELAWQATAPEVDTVSGREIAGERRVQGQRTSMTLVADTGSIEPSDTDDSVPEVGNYYVYQVRAPRDSATRAWSNMAIIDPAARSFGSRRLRRQAWQP